MVKLGVNVNPVMGEKIVEQNCNILFPDIQKKRFGGCKAFFLLVDRYFSEKIPIRKKRDV